DAARAGDPARRPRSGSVAAGLRRADALGARREEPVPAPHSRAHVRRARPAAARAGGDRDLRRRRFHRGAPDDGDRRPPGAGRARVVREIVGENLRIVAVGVVAGWTVAFLIALHLLRGALYPSVFAGIPALLLGVAAFASWLPARRATSVDPSAALRHE